jgi:type I restriction enzyme S subunit
MKYWPTKQLVEICNPKQWPTISAAELTTDGYPVYGANGQIGFYHSYNHEEPTILITCRGATCGTLNISPPRAYVTGNAMALDNPNPYIINFKFLYYALLNRGVDDTITGAAQPQITRSNLSRVSLPVPPLAEQKRIATLLDKADEMRQLRTEADGRMAAVFPALFHKTFGDISSPQHESVLTTIGDLEERGSIIDLQDGNHGESHPKAAEYTAGGVPFIFANHISKNELDLSNCPYLTKERALKLRVGFARPNDVLLSHKGSIGFTAIVPQDLELAVLSPQVTYYRFSPERIDPLYAWGYFQTAAFQWALERVSRQATRAYVGITRQKGLPFLVPPLPTQRKFADRLKEIRNLKDDQTGSRRRLDDLFQSMLHRAFNGEI